MSNALNNYFLILQEKYENMCHLSRVLINSLGKPPYVLYAYSLGFIISQIMPTYLSQTDTANYLEFC